MNVEKTGKKSMKRMAVRSAKECAYIAVFVGLVIASQLAFSAVPGVEAVTVLFVSYAFVFGWKRGMAAATAFALLRQLVFGFFANVLILYLVYYNLLALTFGLLGRAVKNPLKSLWIIVLIACVCTVSFTALDNVITPLWYGYTKQAARTYFYGSLAVMLPQVICSAVSVALLFVPLQKTFSYITKKTGA